MNKVKDNIKKKRRKNYANFNNNLIDLVEEGSKEFSPYTKKKNKNDTIDKVTEILYNYFEKIKQLAIDFSRDYYDSFDNSVELKIEDLLYEGDNLSTRDRVEKIFSTYNDKQSVTRLLSLNLILITEGKCIQKNVIKSVTSADYVVIHSENDCDICNEYADGEAWREDEIELPPYHPNCLCDAEFYESSDIEGDL